MCEKRSYTAREAGEVINAARHNRYQRSKKIPKRKYLCDVCGMYHLTSLKFFEEREIK